MAQDKGCRLCLPLGIAWLFGIVALAALDWPRVPLDMSPEDAGTQAALQGAVYRHVMIYTAIALAPLLLAWLVRRMTGRN